jgi:4-amino-4-deoxychorismate lyase
MLGMGRILGRRCGTSRHNAVRFGQNGWMSKTALALLNQPSADVPPHNPGAPAFELVDPSLPHVSVLDLAATRGDGIFEALGVTSAKPHAIDAHLARFAKSAAKLDLPIPNPAVWRAAIDAIIEELDDDIVNGSSEALIKLVMSRGIEGDPEARPTGWVYGWQSPDHTPARTNGIAVITLDRGYRHDVETTSPWLLAGAKTLSYAVNRAVLREAARRGADDVIFVSSDGFVLEGPTSSVLFRRGNSLLTPGTGLGILDGTTQGDLFQWAATKGMQTGFELLTPADLAKADSLWLVSSGRQAAAVRSLDGVEREIDRELTAEMNAYLLTRKI